MMNVDPPLRREHRRPTLFRLTCVLVACAMPATLAQETNKPTVLPGANVGVPAGSLLKAAPEFSKWTVSYSYPGDAKPGSAPQSGRELRQRITTKTKSVVREELIDVKGQHSESWYVGRLQYRKPPDKTAWYVSAPPDNFAQDPDYNPLPPNGFRDWDWVGRDSYAGTLALEDGPCFLFVPGGAAKVDLTNPSRIKEQLAAQPMVAYVSQETRLPIALRMGVVTQRYQFAPSPDVVQALPPDLAGQIKKTEEARGRLLQPAARPY